MYGSSLKKLFAKMNSQITRRSHLSLGLQIWLFKKRSYLFNRWASGTPEEKGVVAYRKREENFGLILKYNESVSTIKYSLEVSESPLS